MTFAEIRARVNDSIGGQDTPKWCKPKLRIGDNVVVRVKQWEHKGYTATCTKLERNLSLKML